MKQSQQFSVLNSALFSAFFVSIFFSSFFYSNASISWGTQIKLLDTTGVKKSGTSMDKTIDQFHRLQNKIQVDSTKLSESDSKHILESAHEFSGYDVVLINGRSYLDNPKLLSQFHQADRGVSPAFIKHRILIHAEGNSPLTVDAPFKWSQLLSLDPSIKICAGDPKSDYNRSHKIFLQLKYGRKKGEEIFQKFQKHAVWGYGDYPQSFQRLDKGECQLALVNHYYLPLWEKRNPDSFAKLNRVVFAEKENSENFVYFGVAKNSKNKKAAQQFISWLLSDAGQKTYTNLSKLIPLKKTAENSNQTEK